MDRPVTLITGTRTGIGRSLAEYYITLDHTVVGCSRGETDFADEHYRHFCLNVVDEKNVKGLFGWLRREFGTLDHLINNAGIASINHSILTPMATVQLIMETNLSGTFLFCREAAKLMKKKGFGRIVNFTSVAVPLELEGEAVYAASKAAVLSLTRILAREFSDFGITVNAVGPNPIETDLIEEIPRAKIDAVVNRQAVQRLGTVEDVANVVDFFLRKESDFVTGQCLYLGGV